MTLRQAFLAGIVSPTLLALWEKEYKVSNIRLGKNSGTAHIGFLTASFCLFFAFGAILIWNDDKVGSLSILVGIPICLILNFIFRNDARKFIRACRTLSTKINFPAYKAEDELRKLVFDYLVVKALLAVVSAENGDHETNTKDKIRFSEEFEFFKIFGLTEKDWHPYFNEARKRFESAPVTANVPTIVEVDIL